MTSALVEARDLARRFGSGEAAVEALKGASFNVAPGDGIALMGSSGSGKSTLLNLVAGLDEATSGRIVWPSLGGRDRLRPLAVGMIHQFSSLIPTLTVAENVALPLRLGHLAGNGPSVSEAIEAMGLTSFADHLPSELSGGQVQRAAIARSLAHRPKLLIGDEPTGQLDAATAQSVLDTLLAYSASSGAALLIATHDQAVADRMPTTWSMHRGQLRVQTPDVQR